MSDERGVNTVVDVSLAVLFLAVAVGVLAGLPTDSAREHDPRDADRTADVLGGSTTSITYTLEAEGDDRSAGASDPTVAVERVTHGTIASHVATLAVSSGSVEGGPELRPGTGVGSDFHERLDGRVRTALVNASFETRVIGRWEAFEDSPLAGEGTVGGDPPRDGPISATTMRVPSGFEPVRTEAVDAVDDRGEYDVVATLIAESVIEGYLPSLALERDLETSGAQRDIALARYERVATVVANADPADEALADALQVESVDTVAANQYLVEKLAGQLEAELADSFPTAPAAAAAVTVGEVMIAVETWER